MTGKNLFVWAVALLPLAAGGAGCGDESRVKELCKYREDCGAAGSQEECKEIFGVMELSNSCFDAMLEAPCEEHLVHPSSAAFAPECWEPCVGSEQMCDGDTVTRCESDYLFVFDCESVCKLEYDGTYTGVCGTLGPHGEPSDVPVCWCQA